MNAPAEVAHLGVYLSAYLAPFQQWLADENVTEILVNAPGEVWTESAGTFGMTRHDAPEIDVVSRNCSMLYCLNGRVFAGVLVAA